MGKASRPVLLSKSYDPKTSGYITEDILAMEGIWLVVYEGQPISIRREQRHRPGAFKYIKLMYPEQGRAELMARQLNQEHRTDKFKVVQLNRLFNYIRGEDYVPVSVDQQRPKTPARRGRPRGGGGMPKATVLINKRIVVVDEKLEENIGNFLD